MEPRRRRRPARVVQGPARRSYRVYGLACLLARAGGLRARLWESAFSEAEARCRAVQATIAYWRRCARPVRVDIGSAHMGYHWTRWHFSPPKVSRRRRAFGSAAVFKAWRALAKWAAKSSRSE